MELSILNPGANEEENTTRKPSDFRGLIAVDDALDVHVIATTNDCELVDLFINGRGPIDNGIGYTKEDDLDVGVYHVQFLPWCHKDEWNGDYDGGVYIKVLSKCSDVPAEFLCGGINENQETNVYRDPEQPDWFNDLSDEGKDEVVSLVRGGKE